MTSSELRLSDAYREAQRVLTYWLEQRTPGAIRRSAFAVRAALAKLEQHERHRLARWLAWLQVAAGSRGEAGPQARLQRLDGALFHAYQQALQRLPAMATGAHERRLSA
ncbi:MAG: hypothetical protein ABW154_02125 [Dyella sp.]